MRHQTLPTRLGRRRRAAVLAFAILLPTLLALPPVRAGLQILGLVHRDQPFLELAFRDPAQPAAGLQPDGTIQVDFVVKAHGISDTFSYRVVAAGEHSTTIASGLVTLADGEERAITAHGHFTCTQRPQALEVQVDGPRQPVVRYWVQRIDIGGGGSCVAQT